MSWHLHTNHFDWRLDWADWFKPMRIYSEENQGNVDRKGGGWMLGPSQQCPLQQWITNLHCETSTLQSWGAPFPRGYGKRILECLCLLISNLKIEINFASSRQALFLIFGPCVRQSWITPYCQTPLPRTAGVLPTRGWLQRAPFNILWYTVVCPLTWIYMVYNLVLTRLKHFSYRTINWG